jgi:hypothetical protein
MKNGSAYNKALSYISVNIKVMKKIVLIGLIGMSLISCKKENTIVLKYAYITQDNIEYSKVNHKTITTRLCSYDTSLSLSEVIAEQDRLKSLSDMSGKTIIADTLVEISDNVTDVLFAQVGM